MTPTSWNVICCLLVPCLFPFISTKEYNLINSKHKSFYPKHKHDIHFDNKVIPEDTEIDVFLHRHQIQKLFFMLEGGYRPISVTVTPCSTDTTLEWKISHSLFQNSLSSSNYLSAAAYVGRYRRSYTNPRAPPGLYTLEFRADEESSAKVLVTTRPTTQMPYHPPLPPESGVKIVKIKRNRILIAWKPSLSGKSVEYCVSSNNRGNYNSLCSASSDIKKSFDVRSKELKKKNDLEKARSKNPSNWQKIAQAEKEVNQAQEDAAQMTQNMGRMVERFEKKKIEDLKHVFLEFVKIEMIFHAKALELYSKAHNVLKAIHIEEDLHEFTSHLKAQTSTLDIDALSPLRHSTAHHTPLSHSTPPHSPLRHSTTPKTVLDNSNTENFLHMPHKPPPLKGVQGPPRSVFTMKAPMPHMANSSASSESFIGPRYDS